MSDSTGSEKHLLEEVGKLRERITQIENIEGESDGVVRLLNDIEESIRFIYEDFPLGYQSLDESGRIIDINDAWLGLLGYRREEVTGKWFGEFLPAEHIAHFSECLRNVIQRGSVHNIEMTLVRKDGSQATVLLDGKTGRTRYRNYRFIYCIWKDITKQKKSNETLLASRNYLRTLTDSICDVIFEVRYRGTVENRTISFVNNAVESVFGYKPEEVTGKNPLFLYAHADDYNKATERSIEVLRQNADNYTLECMYKRKNGEEFHGETNIRFIFNDDGSCVGAFAVIRDITCRKNTEKTSLFYNRLLDNSINEIFIFDEENWKFLYANATALHNIDYTLDELSKLTPCDINPAINPHLFRKMLEPLANGRKSRITFKTTHQRKNGSTYPVEVHLEKTVYGSFPVFIGICFDITERIKVHKELSLQETLLNEVEQAIIVIDPDGIVKYCNRFAEKFCVREADKLYGKKLTDVIHFDFSERIDSEILLTLSGGNSWRGEIEIICQDDSVITLLMTCVPQYNEDGEFNGGIIVSHDVTDYKQIKKKKSESEAKLRSVFLATPVGIGVVIDRVFHMVNDRFCSIVGYSREELIGKSSRMVYPDDEEYNRVGTIKYERIIENGIGVIETRFRRKDGNIIDVVISSSPIDQFDLSAGVTFTVLDITEQHRYERALLESERRYKDLFDNMKNGVAVYEAVDCGNDFMFKDFNKAAESLEKLKKDDVIGKRLSEIFPGVVKMGFLKLLQNVWKTGTPVYCEPTFYHDERIEGWRENYLYKLPTGEVIAVYNDLTDRKKAEEERDRLFNLSIDLLCVSGFDGYMRQVNPAWSKTLGWSKEELLQKPYMELIHPDDRHKVEIAFALLKKGQKVRNLEDRFMCKDGSFRWISCNMFPLPEVERSFNVGRDITDRKKMEEEREKLIMLIENSTELIGLLTLRGDILYLNKTGKNMLGLKSDKEARLLTILDCLPEKDKQIYETMILPEILEKGRWEGEGSVVNIQTRSVLAVDIHAFLIESRERHESVGIAVIIRDVTERQKLTFQLTQAQKMEAIGTLAGGIAHDFNNILGVIIGYTEMAIAMEYAENSQIPDFLDQINMAAIRAKELVKQILTFSRINKTEKQLLMVSIIVKETLKLLRASLPSTIEIRREIEAENSVILADSTQIHQVLLNLCTNAAHSMREHGGVLTVSLKNYDVDGDQANGQEELNPGHYIKLTVSDTGEGIRKEIIDRIFEPYFTTKIQGEGTGMGLAVVHGIVKEHGGIITVVSEIGKGTAFNVFLPRSFEEVKDNGTTLKPIIRGKGTILFVDDEEIVVDMNMRLLERLGYTVIGVRDSLEALKIFRERYESIDMVITDQTMPVMTGMDLAKEILKLKPDIPIILCTGYSELVTSDRIEKTGIRKLLMKPLTMRDMAEAIDKVFKQET